MPRRSISLVLFLFLLPQAWAGKDLVKALAPHYREWLTRDVCYLITNEERDAFLHLTTDADRDKFIERFWEIRNPNPGSPANTYKDEIYRRIAYTEQWYGYEGWRTDRGRVYITLGAPKQVAKYLGFANIRPMEIWFYSGDHPALPPYFYVVFYQREVGGDFRLYSPFMDGPDKLVTGPFENDRVSSWNLIQHDAGGEVARTVLSLLPTEPVDTTTATSSMASDMLLNNIRNLANHPLNKELLQERRNILESVTHRVVLQGDYLDVLTVPLVDGSGQTNLHYVLRLRRPEDFSLAEDKEKGYYYSASVSVQVLTPSGTPIFTQERKLSQYVGDAQYIKVKNRVFGYEGLLPLPPGKYKLDFQLSNDLAHTTFPAKRDVVVPDRPTEGLRITEMVPFGDVDTQQPDYLPFSAAGIRFTPLKDGLTLAPGQDLEFFYQIWMAPTNAEANANGDLDVEYAYGRMGMHDTQTIKETMARNQFDPNGGLINGKKISTEGLQPGDYRMAITVTDPATHDHAVASFQFRIMDTGVSPLTWDVADPQAGEDVEKGVRDYQRALCYLSQGDQQRAITYLQDSYKKRGDEQTRDRLVDALYSRQAFAEIADLYSRGGITAQTGEQTILNMAESLNRLGQVSKSIQLLQSALPLRQSSLLYLSLARYYQIAGNNQKALEMQEKAKAFPTAPTS